MAQSALLTITRAVRSMSAMVSIVALPSSTLSIKSES